MLIPKHTPTITQNLQKITSTINNPDFLHAQALIILIIHDKIYQNIFILAVLMKTILSQEQRQNFSQKQIIQLQILQYNSLELIEFLNNQSLENPVFEVSTPSHADLYHSDYSKTVRKRNDSEDDSRYEIHSIDKNNLFDFLLDQIRMATISQADKIRAATVLSYLDSNGYISADLDEITKHSHSSEFEIKKALSFLQTLEPKGVCARNLKECLLLQVPRDNELLSYLIENHMEDLAKRKSGVLERACKASTEEIDNAIVQMKMLNPIPAAAFESDSEQIYLNPEMHITAVRDELSVGFIKNSEIDISISDYYLKLYNESTDKEVKEYLKKKVESAIAYKTAIENRKNTMLAITESIAKTQRDYLLRKQNHLNAIDMKTLATEIGVHHSTISRALKDKYVQTPRGTFLMKNLLSQKSQDSEYSTDELMKTLSEIVKSEDKNKPLSDEKICILLNERGYDCKRRTVAKYRSLMKIPSTSERKN